MFSDKMGYKCYFLPPFSKARIILNKALDRKSIHNTLLILIVFSSSSSSHHSISAKKKTKTLEWKSGLKLGCQMRFPHVIQEKMHHMFVTFVRGNNVTYLISVSIFPMRPHFSKWNSCLLQNQRKERLCIPWHSLWNAP